MTEAMTGKRATIFGGTGFIGSQIVRELAKRGITVKVVSRVPERAYFLRPCGVVGQIVPAWCDFDDPASVAQAVAGADYVVNCIAVLNERRRGDFTRLHVDLAREIARACGREGVQRLVHLSALGAENGFSHYAQTKREGEAALRKAFPAATVLRPSVVFGPEDDFFNKFALLARLLPALPLIGGGLTKFQPVYVGDVANAAIAALTLPEGTPADPRGKIFELGGPEEIDLRGIYETVFAATGRRRALINMPWALAKAQGALLSLMPGVPLTADQVETLKADSVVSAKALTLADLGIAPTAMELIVPSYLARYRSGGRFADKLRA
jgi:NADH dehydrogenase